MSTNETFEIARLGVETERFLNTPVGTYLLERAEVDRNKAIEEFRTVNPADAIEVARIQNALDTPDRIVRWLSEAIQSGYAAHDALRNQEAEQER